MQNDENLHKGHRQRMLTKYLENSINSLEEHEILEVLLFFAFSRCNTNELSHELIRKFGSIENVLNAPIDELSKVKGIGRSSAVLLRFLGDFIDCFSMPDNSSVRLNSIEQVVEFCKLRFQNAEKEFCHFIMLDKRNYYIACISLSECHFSSVNINLKTVLMKAFNVNASSAVIVHNHPNSTATASNNDVKNTRVIAQTLSTLNIGLIDHVIIGTDGCYSMRSEHLLEDIWK